MQAPEDQDAYRRRAARQDDVNRRNICSVLASQFFMLPCVIQVCKEPQRLPVAGRQRKQLVPGHRLQAGGFPARGQDPSHQPVRADCLELLQW
jgi:hypothetical protein